MVDLYQVISPKSTIEFTNQHLFAPTSSRDFDATTSPHLVGGIPAPLKKYEFVSWDDEIPNIWKHKIQVPNHQPDKFHSYGHLLVITGYKWVYTFYKWCFLSTYNW